MQTYIQFAFFLAARIIVKIRIILTLKSPGSSNVTDSDASPFNVLVSVDLNSSISDTKTMKTFNCNARSNSTDGRFAVDSILSQMESATALFQWADGLDRILYTGANTKARTDAAQQLEQYLNTMTMVQGGSNSVLSLPSIHDFEYGCMKDKTSIALGVFVLVIFTAFILVLTFLYWIILLLIISIHAMSRVKKRRSGLGIKNIKPVPDDIIGWMLQAARENVQSSDANADSAPKKRKDLRDWCFTIVDSSQGVARMVRTRGNVTTNMTVQNGGKV